MKVTIFLTARDGSYNATALYEDGKVTVQEGSLIRLSFASHIRGGRISKRYRDDPSVVGNDGKVKKDCVFSSPSTAAQFVMGSSTNGWTAWHVDKRTSLRKYVDDNTKEG